MPGFRRKGSRKWLLEAGPAVPDGTYDPNKWYGQSCGLYDHDRAVADWTLEFLDQKAAAPDEPWAVHVGFEYPQFVQQGRCVPCGLIEMTIDLYVGRFMIELLNRNRIAPRALDNELARRFLCEHIRDTGSCAKQTQHYRGQRIYVSKYSQPRDSILCASL